jgi:WD40 repeat protein
VDGFLPEQSEAYVIDISPMGNRIASARGDGTVWLQSLPDGKVIARLGTNQVSASSLAFSMDGSLLAAHLPDGTITIWHITESGTETSSITLSNTYKTNGYIGELAFSPDNHFLASTGAIGEVTLWSIPEGKVYTVETPVPDGMVFSLAFSENGDRLAAVFENVIFLWGIPKERPSSYYAHASADSLVDTNPHIEIITNGFPVPRSIYNDISGGNLGLDQAAKSLAFPLIVPTHLPEDMSFYAAAVNSDGSVWLRYDVFNQQAYRASLYIYEKNIGNTTPPTLTIGASADIIQTQVAPLSGSVPAEYVRGDWSVSPSFTQPQGNSTRGDFHDVWKWDNGSNSQRLRWQQNGVFVAFYYQPYIPYSEIIGAQGSNPEWTYINTELGQADMQQIASGMLPFSEMNAVTISYLPGRANSISSYNTTWFRTDQLYPATVDKIGINHRVMIATK